MTEAHRTKLPMRLALLPGLKWKGTVRVEERTDDGLWQVQFDAEATSPDVVQRYISDRTTLTDEQLKKWTGVKIERRLAYRLKQA